MSLFIFDQKDLPFTLSEDQEDLKAFSQRANESTLSYEALLEDLKSHGKNLVNS